MSEPIVEPEVEGVVMAGAGRRRRVARFWIRRIFLGCVVLGLIPAALTILYVPSFVHPVSTLMLWRWAKGARVERSFVALERISPALPLAVIAAEDARCSPNYATVRVEPSRWLLRAINPVLARGPA